MVEPIGSYGLLGDTRTAALVSEDGSVDWLCLPRFDGDPVFGALIDPEHGGTWSIKPARASVIERAYTAGAVSLRTTWDGPSGRVVVHEGMISDVSSHLMPRAALLRRVTCLSGEAEIDVTFDPRRGLPGRAPNRARQAAGALVCEWRGLAIGLTNDVGVVLEPGRRCTFRLRAGGSASFAMSVAAREPPVLLPPSTIDTLLQDDDRWWQMWLRRFDHHGPHEENIARSLLTLRLLTYAPSGAPVAAPTTSLPAANRATWDYRFSWPRDASIGVGAFLAFGSDEEPRAFLDWFVNASRITRPKLKVLYTLDGRPVRHERELPVDGYRGVKPVRVGNGAAQQHQLDVYGWVIDAASLLHGSGNRLSGTQWRAIRSFADHICATWREPDHGIWEGRGPPQHFVHSKLMAWTGLDRALRLADSYPAGRRPDRWRAERDQLASEIRERGYDRERRTYLRAFDHDELDASVLILPVLEFDEGSRLHTTIDAIRRDLDAGGPLLYRYHRDEAHEEGAFLPCSFWLVQALARTGLLDEAEQTFDELCALASPLGLYGEQIDPVTREPAGNFPQAFTHATFLQAAAALNEARGTSRASTRTTRDRTERPPASARRS